MRALIISVINKSFLSVEGHVEAKTIVIISCVISLQIIIIFVILDIQLYDQLTDLF